MSDPTCAMVGVSMTNGLSLMHGIEATGTLTSYTDPEPGQRAFYLVGIDETAP
jgi:hypothetical protein